MEQLGRHARQQTEKVGRALAQTQRGGLGLRTGRTIFHGIDERHQKGLGQHPLTHPKPRQAQAHEVLRVLGTRPGRLDLEHLHQRAHFAQVARTRCLGIGLLLKHEAQRYPIGRTQIGRRRVCHAGRLQCLLDGPQRGFSADAHRRERLRKQDKVAHGHDGQGIGGPGAQHVGGSRGMAHGSPL